MKTDRNVEFLAEFFREQFGPETEAYYRAQASALGYYALQPAEPTKTAPMEVIERAVELWFEATDYGGRDQFFRLPTWEQRYWLDRAAEDEKSN